MANLTISSVRLVRFDQEDVTPGIAGETLIEGQYVRKDVTTGKWVLGNATTTAEVGVGRRGIATRDASANAPVTIAHEALVDVGEALAALNFGASVYLSNTDGTLADIAGTVSTVVGTVEPAANTASVDRLLAISLK